MKKTNQIILRRIVLIVLSFVFLFSASACVSTPSTSEGNTTDSSLNEKVSELESQLKDAKEQIEKNKDEFESKLQDAQNKIDELEGRLEDATNVSHMYDFYITLGTMPTLYATLNAYTKKNPNTFMWFYRGNTISYDYSAPYITYFDNQSKTNDNSVIDYSLIRQKVKDILEMDPEAKFHLYCDDLRVSFIPNIFVYAGVDFEDLQVTLLSDGTGTYSNFNKLTDSSYAAQAKEWTNILNTYKEGRNDPDFEQLYKDDDQAMQLQYYAFYVSTFSNVEYWIQSPEYLVTKSATVENAKKDMHIIGKNPADMYKALDDRTRSTYQKAVLANALVGSDTLKTLDDAAKYFNDMLSGRDKETVLILGTNKKTLDENKFYIDETLKFYTPTLSTTDKTKVIYKNKEYTIKEGDTSVTIDGKEMKIGELGVYLFFKGHPAHPADSTLQNYFKEHGITVLPHRTPVETLFWMYEDVKVGGYQSTSFLSCVKGQTEFFYEDPTNEALVQMSEAGFFEGAAVFKAEQN